MTKLRYLTPEELYEIEVAARHARNAELARLMATGAKAVKSLILRFVPTASGGKAVRHA